MKKMEDRKGMIRHQKSIKMKSMRVDTRRIIKIAKQIIMMPFNMIKFDMLSINF